jgi:hypothetical protein
MTGTANKLVNSSHPKSKLIKTRADDLGREMKNMQQNAKERQDKLVMAIKLHKYMRELEPKPKIPPRITPRVTLRTTPRTTPKLTPRITPRTTPKTTLKTTPMDTKDDTKVNIKDNTKDKLNNLAI